MKAMPRWWAVLAAGLAAVSWAGLPGGGGRAEAHQGGLVQVALDACTTMSEGPGTWHSVATLVDKDSGAPAWGLDVTLRGAGPNGAELAPVPFQNMGKGRYEAHFAARPGRWRFTLTARPSPGGQAALPLDAPMEMTLTEGLQASSGRMGAGSMGPGRKHGGGGLPLVAVLVIVPVLVAGGVMTIRRRPAAPVAVR